MRKLLCTLLITLACCGFALAQGAQKQSSEASRSFTIETGPRTVATVEIERSTALSDPVITVKTEHKLDNERPRAFGKGFVISSLIYAAGSAYDTKTTQIAVDHYGLQEKNPLYRGEGGSFLQGRNAAVTAGIYAVLLPFQKRWPRETNLIRTIAGSIRLGLGAWNTRQILTHKRIN